jgi:hypothetical protein
MGVEIISTYSKRRNKLELIMNSISPIECINKIKKRGEKD